MSKVYVFNRFELSFYKSFLLCLNFSLSRIVDKCIVNLILSIH